MILGNSNVIKVGQCFTDRLAERATEHGRRFGCPKQVKILSSVAFTSRATCETLEKALIKACQDAGLVGIIDLQNGETERFAINSTVKTVTVQARKKAYTLQVC
jgi:hypothetical protein